MRASDWKYCPRCRAELKKTAAAFECLECGMTIYKNSAPTASVLIMRGGRLLLARRKVEPFKGQYDVIGGFLEYGEHPLHGARREALEETGLTIKILDQLGVYMDTYGPGGKSLLNFYYVGSVVSGRMRARDDVAALEWFPSDNLPMPAFKSQLTAFKDLQKWLHRHHLPG